MSAEHGPGCPVPGWRVLPCQYLHLPGAPSLENPPSFVPCLKEDLGSARGWFELRSGASLLLAWSCNTWAGAQALSVVSSSR